MKKQLILTSLAVITLLASCKKKDDDSPAPSGVSYAVPSSYNYSNADYSDDSTVLVRFKAMETALKVAIPTSSTAGQAVDSATLAGLFSNYNAVSISSQNADPNLVLTYIGKYAAASQAAVYSPAAVETANEGTAGLLKNASGTYLLLGVDGINYAQMIQKVQFGSIMIQQIINRLNGISALDNTVLVSGKTYTAQQHAWDEAFGYMGFPQGATVANLIDTAYVKANKSKFFYIGNYSTQTDNTTNLLSTKTLATAFILGRAAINNQDYTTRDLQIDIIELTLRKFLGATILQEYTEYQEHAAVNDIAAINGVLSEMIGMVEAMKYVPGKIISDAQIQDLLDHLHATDIWQITPSDIEYVKNQVIQIYSVNLK